MRQLNTALPSLLPMCRSVSRTTLLLCQPLLFMVARTKRSRLSLLGTCTPPTSHTISLVSPPDFVEEGLGRLDVDGALQVAFRGSQDVQNHFQVSLRHVARELKQVFVLDGLFGRAGAQAVRLRQRRHLGSPVVGFFARQSALGLVRFGVVALLQPGQPTP